MAAGASNRSHRRLSLLDLLDYLRERLDYVAGLQAVGQRCLQWSNRRPQLVQAVFRRW
jgi:hypothetical protein